MKSLIGAFLLAAYGGQGALTAGGEYGFVPILEHRSAVLLFIRPQSLAQEPTRLGVASAPSLHPLGPAPRPEAGGPPRPAARVRARATPGSGPTAADGGGSATDKISFADARTPGPGPSPRRPGRLGGSSRAARGQLVDSGTRGAGRGASTARLETSRDGSEGRSLVGPFLPSASTSAERGARPNTRRSARGPI